jgi:hypothetical protein
MSAIPIHSLSTLPAQAAAAIGSRIIPAETKFNVHDLTGEQRKRLFERERIVKEYNADLKSGARTSKTNQQITALFIAGLEREKIIVSERTLRTWRNDYHDDGLRGLVDSRWEKLPTRTWDSEDDPFLEEVKKWWLDQRQRSAKLCYGIAEAEAIRQGWKVTGYRRVCQLLKALPQTKVVRAREGPEAHNNKCGTYLERDYSTLHTNELWCADDSELDVMCNDNGVPCRPWISCWQDVRSRRIVGYCIFNHAPNQNTILSAFRMGCLAHGVAETILIDNGRPYCAYTFHGATKKERREFAMRRRKGKLEVDEKLVGGILGTLGITAKFCTPFGPQGKPVERFFRRMEDQFCKTFQTYFGRGPEHRPEDYQQKFDKGEAPKLADFIAAAEEWIEQDYNQSVHLGDSMDGRSPVQVFNASWNGFSKRTTTEDMMKLLLMKQTQPTRAGRNGVKFMGVRYGQYEPALIPWMGRNVYLRVDERDISKVQVWTPEDRFICFAVMNKNSQFNFSEQELRAVLTEQNRFKKIEKEYHKRKPRIAEDLTDLMLRAAAKRNAKAAADNPQPAPTPPNSIIVRSDLDGELNKVQDAIERNSLKINPAAAKETFSYLSNAFDERLQIEREAEEREADERAAQDKAISDRFWYQRPAEGENAQSDQPELTMRELMRVQA